MVLERRPSDEARRHNWSRIAVSVILTVSLVAVLGFVATGRAGASSASSPSPVASLQCPILMYHYVDASPVAGAAGNRLTVRTREFERQMDFLAQKGYHTVSLAQVHAAMTGGAALPAKPIVLTFDDGGLDDYTVAYPILRSHGFVGAFFVITASVGEATSMTWSQLQEMQRNGMEIQSHTESHPDLTKLTNDALTAELSRSRLMIQAQLGTAPIALSYPFGYYNRRVIDSAQAAGYLMAVTTHQGRTLASSSIFSLPRIHVNGTQTFKDFERSLGFAVTL